MCLSKGVHHHHQPPGFAPGAGGGRGGAFTGARRWAGSVDSRAIDRADGQVWVDPISCAHATYQMPWAALTALVPPTQYLFRYGLFSRTDRKHGE